MAFTNYETKEINCKVIYFGARGAGKTENLRSIFKSTSKELQAGLLEMEDSKHGKHFFEFLPVSIGYVGQYHFKMHLYTLPLSGLYETVNTVILKGVDGYIFVADSRLEAMAANIKAQQDLKHLLTDEGYNVAELPRVIQYNKRDAREIVSLDILRQELNPSAAPDHEAVATDSKGTLETLQSMSKIVLQRLSAP
jgi:signal recognition particle receptor subunit beta